MSILQIARSPIREYPALVVEEEIPEPWANANAIAAAAKAMELRSHHGNGADRTTIMPSQSKI
jgi:hypothetical protein